MHQVNTNVSLLRDIIKELTTTIRKQDFLTYFKKVSLLEQTAEKMSFGVVSSFMRDNLAHKFFNEILTAVQKSVPTIITIDFHVDKNIDNPSNSNVIDCGGEYKEMTTLKKKKEETPGTEMVEGINSRIINSKYRLENFIVGPSNQLAHAAAEAVVRKPGSAYNPLFVYGDVGLGKTHILQAVGNSIKERYKDKKVIYTTADRFLSDYIESVKKRTVDRMKEKYQSIDVLIIDDVQFLAGKDATQTVLYNIFNTLYENNKQIILSGDRPPKELTALEPRLQSRFEWGIIVDIGIPDFETRLAILQEKARAREFILPQEVAEFIAYNLGANVREIEGVLNQIIAEYELHNIPPTIDNVARRLNKLSITDSLIGNSTKKMAASIKTYEELLDAVASHFGIEKQHILGDDRKKQNMIPRQVAMYLLKNRMNYTYERIGNIFSGRNHSAVLYSCKKLETILKKDQNLFYEINILRDKLGI
ncbi:chromosomal replication initiator protein DnaA [Candidatus Gracilibacteria bacterium CG2_30_37_12]|nr:MAG: chromosomal replication initiator protein DnaA [Candidatus Gracilibacteria bacterium CG2_30_37_12]